jgi:hypothetical protein
MPVTSSLLYAQRWGKIRVPVKPLYSIYAHFKHITGFPSWQESEQVPFNKLRLLDNQIDRAARVRSNQKAAFGDIEAADSSEMRDPSRIDKELLRQNLQRGPILRQNLQNTPAPVKPFVANLLPAAGTLVNIVA